LKAGAERTIQVASPKRGETRRAEKVGGRNLEKIERGSSVVMGIKGNLILKQE